MTTIKFLLAGLIATGLFSMPAGAHENASTKRYGVTRGTVGPGSSGEWIYGNARISAPNALLPSPPQDEPGGVCDHGDNAMIC